VNFESLVRRAAVTTVVGAIAALVVSTGLAGCGSSSAPAGPKDFCGDAKATGAACKDPTACDTQLEGACAELPKALSPATMTAAQDCLESGICGVSACVSRSLIGTTPTAAHAKLAADFCQFCAPSLTDCVASFYKRGGKAAGLVVLPYSEAVVSAVDDACTGSSGCQAKFHECAAGIIADRVGAALDAATADCVVSGFTNSDSTAPVGPDGKPQVVTCTPANCNGCCRDDKCESGDSTAACGVGAKACELCSGTANCVAGACKEPCGPNTCAGCCDGDTCLLGAAKDKCGDKGGACNACAGAFVCSNHTCIDGSCQATCKNGCCSATGCQPGNVAKACGTSGEACVDCGVGRTCTAAACVLDRTSLWDVYISFAVLPDKDKTGASWDTLNGAPDPYLDVYTSEGTSSHSGETTVITDSTVPFWAETPVKGVKASELLNNTSIEIWDSDPTFDDYVGGCQLPLTPAIFDGSLQSHVCPATASGVEVKVYFRINPH
jgi:hypothetical protein